MDSLASSHIAYSRPGSGPGRNLVVTLFVLTLLRHGIMGVAGASTSGFVSGVSSVSEGSLAQLRILDQKAGSADVLHQIGTERASLANISPPRRLLGDISSPGMWPSPDGQDGDAVAQREFSRRSLLTGTTSPPPLGPWFVVMHSSQDGEDAFLRQALAAEKSYPLIPLALIINKLKQLGASLNVTSLGFRIRLPGSSNTNSVVLEGSKTNIENQGDQNLRAFSERDRVLSDRSPDISRGSKTQSRASENLDGSMARSEAVEHKFPSRSLLQGDISPPGMWPDADDDESQLSESILLRRRRLLTSSM